MDTSLKQHVIQISITKILRGKNGVPGDLHVGLIVNQLFKCSEGNLILNTFSNCLADRGNMSDLFPSLALWLCKIQMVGISSSGVEDYVAPA